MPLIDQVKLCDHLVVAVGLLFALADALQSRSAQDGQWPLPGP
jgi:hypothetical protein